MKTLIILIITITLSGCSSVSKITDQTQVIDYGKNCKVTVYQTELDALSVGEIIPVGNIYGASLGMHTPENAIKRHAKKACKLGASNVYVESRQGMKWGPASASMVAFQWKDG